LNLPEASKYLGAVRAVELACFRRLGERARWLEPASCARWASSASLAHAWRASELEVLLPVSVGLPGADELTVLPTSALADELARALPEGAGKLAGAESRDSQTVSGPRLVADIVERLYPLLLVEYARHLLRPSPASDGPMLRGLGRAAADLEAIRADGAALCDRHGWSSEAR
jgi:hypothetical protein